MKLVSISGIGLSTRVQKSEAGAFELFIGLLIPFSLETGEVIVSEDCNPFSIFEKVRSAYGINYSIDYGYPKASAEYLAFATCYPPARESGPIYISIDIADCCKELAVFGDRKLTALGTFGPPANFNSMPVIPSRAFTGSISETAIPNVEYPDQLCVDANDVPKPAGYWPRALNEPRRLSALGDFDQQWLARRWPHLPTDTEPEFFFSAPKDQRLSGYLVGGESVRIVNMHPDFPLIETTVPRINPCVFVEKTDALGEDVFVQLETRIDTLWLLPDEMVGILLARGSTSCQYSSAKDVKAVYATVKMQDEAPDTLDEHYQQYLVLSGRALQVATPDAVKKQASEPDVLAEATLFAAEPAEVAVTPLAEPEPLSAADQAIIDQLNADRSELDALTAEAQSLMPAGVTEESMRKFMSQFAQRPMTDEKAIAAIKKLSTDFASYLEMTGLDKSKMIEVLKSNPDMEHLASQAAGLPDDLSLLFTDLEQSFNLLIQRNAELKALVEAPKEELSPDVAPETPTEPPLSIHSREWVIAQYEAGKSFAGIELIGLDLSRLNLSGSVFSGATIDDCNLDQTVFKEARLDQLVVTGVFFQS
jgi:hypothetical protein